MCMVIAFVYALEKSAENCTWLQLLQDFLLLTDCISPSCGLSVMQKDHDIMVEWHGKNVKVSKRL